MALLQILQTGVGWMSVVSSRASHLLFETIVHVDVGFESVRYIIHNSFWCSRSDYFEAAFNVYFREGEDQVVTLDDEDAETFRGFNAWLYTDVVVEDIGSQRSR